MLPRFLETANFNNYEAILITNDTSRQYLTQFNSSSGMCVILKDISYFITDFRYIESAEANIKDMKIIMANTDYTYIDALTEIIKRHNISCMAFENENITYKQFNNLKNGLDVEFIPLGNILMELRSVKEHFEIENISKAQKIAEKAFDEILDFISIRKTEIDIAAYVTYLMMKFGAEGVSFKPIIASGANSSLPHGVPSDKPLCAGEFIIMDFGCIYKGYCSDMTRTITIGYATEEMEQVYNIVLEAQLESIKNIKAGVSGDVIHKIAADIIERNGYGEYFGHGLGHSLGLEIHENPRFNTTSKDILVKNNILTVEPGIYIPSKFGVRIEDMVLVTEDSCVNLTNARKNLMIL